MSKTGKETKRRVQRVIIHSTTPPEVYGNFKLFCKEKGLNYEKLIMNSNFTFPFDFNGVKVYRESIKKGNATKNMNE